MPMVCCEINFIYVRIYVNSSWKSVYLVVRGKFYARISHSMSQVRFLVLVNYTMTAKRRLKCLYESFRPLKWCTTMAKPPAGPLKNWKLVIAFPNSLVVFIPLGKMVVHNDNTCIQLKLICIFVKHKLLVDAFSTANHIINRFLTLMLPPLLVLILLMLVIMLQLIDLLLLLLLLVHLIEQSSNQKPSLLPNTLPRNFSCSTFFRSS